ncbi:MAG: S8 family serine peptidase [Nitrospirae bacterium]|nr:S8 family serine peptidase [Nitrospirota bacterium]
MARFFIQRWPQLKPVPNRRTGKRSAGALRFALEPLEPRLLLSAAPLTVAGVDGMSTEATTAPPAVEFQMERSGTSGGWQVSLDVDGDGTALAETDGKQILRYMAGAVGNESTNRSYLDALKEATPSPLDVDGDGVFSPFVDGRLIYRFQASATRTSPLDIVSFLRQFDPHAATAPSAAESNLIQESGASSSDRAVPAGLPPFVAAQFGLTTSASPVALAIPEESSAATTLTPNDATTDAADALVGLNVVRSDPRFAGLTGQGIRIAIIDTGADLDHPFFGPDADHNGVADRIVYQFDFGDGDANANDRSGHGTHVTSLIGSENPGFLGVAPDVEFIILKVFGDNGSGSFGTLESALQWVVANADNFNIGVVNMSLGDSQNWSEAVSLYGISDELAALEAEDVIAVAAAGNNFFSFGSALGVAYPAADPSVLAVGAVWSANFGGPFRFTSGAVDNTTGPDRIASFSQRHPTLLDVFAPGARFTGAGLNGGTLLLQGTSQATAYLSGVAVLAQQLAHQELGRSLNLEEFSALLSRTADTILDGDDENDNVINSGFAYARVNVLALAEELAALPVSALSDAYVTNDDTALVVSARGVLANDIALDLESLSAGVVSGPTHGTLDLRPDGSFTYTPSADYAGTDSFRYRAFDGVDFSDPAEVEITIHPVNDAPAGTDRTITMAEDTTYTLTAADFGFTDPRDVPANALLAVQLATPPGVGTLRLDGTPIAAGQSVAAGALAAGTLTYSPPENANGSPLTSLTFRIQDNGGIANGGVDLLVSSTPETTARVGTRYRYEPQVSDPDEGERFVFSLQTAPVGMTIDAATGAVTWMPAPTQLGVQSITLRVTDQAGAATDQSFSITVSPIPGDLNRDGRVDKEDMQIILSGRGSASIAVGDERDLDGDGRITVLDARKWVVQYLS